MSEIIHVTDASFDQDVLNAGLPVLVEFWAAWCGPCKIIAPVLHELAEEYDGRLTIAKLDIDENQTVAARFDIERIPKRLLFKNGELVDTQIGSVPKGAFERFLSTHL